MLILFALGRGRGAYIVCTVYSYNVEHFATCLYFLSKY